MRVLGAKGRTTPRARGRRDGRCLAGVVALALSVSGYACGSDASKAAPTASSRGPVAPVPEPSGLVATFVARDLDGLLGAARELLGARGGVLESRDTLARLVVDLGMPATTLDVFDGARPVVCAVAEDPASRRLSFAWAVDVKDPARLASLATFGADPSFAEQQVEGGVMLVPKRGQAAPLSIGSFGGRLIFASDADALRALGPFLSAASEETASRGGVSGYVDGGFLASLAVDLVGKRLAALPAAARLAIDVEPMVAPLRAAGRIPLSLTISKERATLSMRVPFGEGAAPFGLSRGPRASALVVPRGAQVAVTMFESASSRASSAEGNATALGALLDSGDARAVGVALADLARARGDRTSLSFEIGPKGPALFGDLALVDPALAGRALGGLVDAIDAKTLRGKAREAGFKLAAKKTVLERVGDVVRVRVARLVTGAPTGDPPPDVDLFLRVEGARLLLGAGYDGSGALERATDDASPIADRDARLPENVSLALYVDAARLRDPRGPASSAIFALDVDPSARAIGATLDLDAPAVDALVDLVLTH